MSISLSVEGGTLSANMATLTRGEVESKPITVTQNGIDFATVRLGNAPAIPRDYRGIQMAVGDPLVLFSDRANRAPTIVDRISAKTLGLGHPSSPLDMSAHFSDPDDDLLTYTAWSVDQSVVTVTIDGSELTLTPVSLGSTTAKVRVTDSGGLTATMSINLTVKTNRAPVPIGAIPVQRLKANGAFEQIDVTSYFLDLDNQSLTYTAKSNKLKVATVSVSGAEITITPPQCW